MGFFNKLGRRIGKFEQEARSAAAEDADWGCTGCGSTFGEAPEICPDCGSEQIVALGADEENGTAADGAGAGGEDGNADGDAIDDDPA